MPTTSRRTTRLGILSAVVVAALTLVLSNAAWAQLSLPDVADNAFAASNVDVPILNDSYICGNSIPVLGIDVTGTLGPEWFGNGGDTVCVK
jgi:hypothetical protein